MATNVFANNNEIVSKGADGKSVAAFPDVCWTPPAPPVGPIPLPYPNSTEDKDLDNGTTSVQIKDKTVCMGDTSYIAKSKGDEGATQSQQKNLLTSAIQGKGYFITSSQDVKVEGKGATRHLDMMTHNHGSPAGTPGQGEVSGMGSGGNISTNQPERTEKSKGKLLGIGLVRADTLKDGANIGTTYCFSSPEQIEKVAKSKKILKYCAKTNTPPPDSEHCFLSDNTNGPEYQIVNFMQNEITPPIVKQNGVDTYIYNYLRNSVRIPLQSISMVGNIIKFRLFFSGNKISCPVTLTITRTLNVSYNTNEKENAFFRYGFLHNGTHIDTIQETIATNVSDDFNVNLDLSQGAEYVISVRDTDGNEFKTPKIQSYKKIYCGMYYSPESDAYSQALVNFCASLENIFAGLSCYVDIECVIKEKIDRRYHLRKHMAYFNNGNSFKKYYKHSSVDNFYYKNLKKYIPIFITPDALTENTLTYPNEISSDIVIGNNTTQNHTSFLFTTDQTLFSQHLSNCWAKKLKIKTIAPRIVPSPQNQNNAATQPLQAPVTQTVQGISTPTLNSQIPIVRIAHDKIPESPGVDLIAQYDHTKQEFNVFIDIPQSSITSGMQLLGTAIRNSQTYMITSELTIGYYDSRLGFAVTDGENSVLVIGYHNLETAQDGFIKYSPPPTTGGCDIVPTRSLRNIIFHEIGHVIGLVFCNRRTQHCSGYPCTNISSCQYSEEILPGGTKRHHIPKHSTCIDGHANWYTKEGDLGPHCHGIQCIMFGNSSNNPIDFCQDCKDLLLKAPCREI